MQIPEMVKIPNSDAVKNLAVGKFQVTQEEYESVMGVNPSVFKGSRRPVENVSHSDMEEFCKKLSKATGRKFRLPTEMEWEYACRAGTTTDFNNGTDSLSLNEAAIGRNSKQGTAPVGSYAPNAWGLYDMHGNVWECCSEIKVGDEQYD